MNIKIISITLLIVFGVVGGMVFLSSLDNESVHAKVNLEDFASCIADSGAKFYGASWCGHCSNQKKSFAENSKLLPYIECATPDGRGQRDECEEAEVRSYPTWDFANGNRILGEVSFEVLAEETGCKLPK